MSDEEAAPETMAQKTAFVIGATGSIGKELVRELVFSGRFSIVRTFGRRVYPYPWLEEAGDRASALQQEVVDFDKLEESVGDKMQGLEVGFCCMGTTRKQAGSDAAFRKVDYEYVLHAAQLAKIQGCKHWLLVSSVGADASSWFLYPRTKGEIEKAVSDLGMERTSIYRPSLLDRGAEARTVEKLGMPFMNLLSKYEVMPVARMARVMMAHALEPPASGTAIYENAPIHTFAKEHGL